MEIFSAPWRVIGVEPGHEVPLTKDETACTLVSSQLSSGAHLPISREAAVEVFERVFAFDTMELGWIDYSFKPAKPMVSLDQVSIERLLATTVFPILYGAMPNMGLYYTPDGPYTNPADLLGMMKVDEAREEEMKAAELCMEDMIFVCKRMAEIGADGIDFDTTASAGDADFLATLKTVEELKKTTNLGIEVGMSGEFVLGMHGEVEYKGKKLAGMFPHQQLKVRRGGRRRHLRSRGEHQDQQVGCLERGPRRDLRQGGLQAGHHPDPRQRGHGRRRHADVRDAARSTP